MGNQAHEIRPQIINHPLFKNSTVHLEKKIIKALVPVLDESELGGWVHTIHKIKTF